MKLRKRFVTNGMTIVLLISLVQAPMCNVNAEEIVQVTESVAETAEITEVEEEHEEEERVRENTIETTVSENSADDSEMLGKDSSDEGNDLGDEIDDPIQKEGMSTSLDSVEDEISVEAGASDMTSARSGEKIASGSYKNTTWVIDENGKLIVSGTGEFCSYGMIPWSSWREQIKSAEIYLTGTTYTRDMFMGCSNLTSIDLDNFDTSNVTDLSGMFEGCVSIASLDVSNFDTRKAARMDSMFSRCESLNSLDVGNFNTCQTTRMDGMFAGCKSLDSLDVSSFDTSQVTNMGSMFAECKNLTNLDLSNFNTSQVTNMSFMFWQCIGLNSLNLKKFDTSQVTNMSSMFEECTGLTSLDLSNFDTANVIDMGFMFSYCKNLTNLDVSSFNTGRVTNMECMFEWCENLTSLDVSNFDTIQVTDMGWMFSECKRLDKLDVSNFDTGQVVEMTCMFDCCENLTGLDVSNFNTEQVIKMNAMFGGCKSLTSLDVSGFNTGKVVNMAQLFNGCENIVSLDVSNFDTGNVTNMGSMFNGCNKLPSLDLSNFDMRSARNMSDLDMLVGCYGLSYIRTPKNCKHAVALPKFGTWYDENGTEYTNLPMNLNYSIALYRKSNSGSGDTGKHVVYISGIKIGDKIYDGTPNSYTGTDIVTDVSGKQISDIVLTHSYSGTTADGSIYAETVNAPSQAGNYTLSFQITGTNADQYALNQASYSFRIICKDVTVTAESIEINVGGQLPEVSDLNYTVEGLVGNEPLVKEPSLKYGTDEITTTKEGKYEIIPYDADAGNNYNIKYIKGMLIVGDYGNIPAEDIPDDGVIPEGFWVAGLAESGYDYTGKAIRPQVRVYDHKTLLKEKKDYTIAYTRNTKAYGYDSSDQEFDIKKAPTITVTARGNYSGKETLSFKILSLDISAETFTADDMAVAYKANGVQKPIPVLLWNGKKLKNKADYTVTYYDSYGKKLDSVKEVGKYYIEMVGKGNFGGTRRIQLTVTKDLKLMDRMSVAGIKSQTYTGDVITPVLTVKDGRTKLTEDEHYTVSYSQNTTVGTAYALITGIEENGYSGTKRISFKITGTPISKATVTGLVGQKFTYEGRDITPQLQLSLKVKNHGIETVKSLMPGIDYAVAWQKNRNAGTATVIFTGKGGYTGTLKKTFKITPYDIKNNEAQLSQQNSKIKITLDESYSYVKGGSKPKPAITFDGEELVEKVDYTLSYKNNTSINSGGNVSKLPTITIKGKGNFKGQVIENYLITQADISRLSLIAVDKVWQNKVNIYKTKVTVKDVDGKALSVGKDYDRNISYAYEENTELADGTVKTAGTVVSVKDVIPAGTAIRVTVNAKNINYYGTIYGVYRIAKADISKATVKIPAQIYTGKAIEPNDTIEVKMNGKQLSKENYEIESYSNNINKGTATVTIRGKNDCGGTKIVKFTIKGKGFLWWWKN
ncbi:MAG: BspA family leucine-rich repeat surface protein [Lachnospiraceae bacterium]|nr:BspA family leucine-rich repeat surface protein [Lachnospiraceae bacterium]